MIGFLSGILVQKAPPLLMIEVQGVGYEVEAPMTTFYQLPELGEKVKLYTHLVVREDAHILFGFFAESERLMFRNLIKANGVGPKLALVILSGLTAADFRSCIQDNDVQALVRLPGIGKKTAERLIIEMRDRLPATDIQDAPGLAGNDQPAMSNQSSPKQEATSALLALGYKSQDVSKMLQQVPADIQSCEEMIRYALQGTVK